MIAGKKLNMVNLLKMSLEQEVKKAITEQFVKEKLEEIEETLQERVYEVVNAISFEKIELVKDVLSMRDELHVFLHCGEEEEERKL